MFNSQVCLKIYTLFSKKILLQVRFLTCKDKLALLCDSQTDFDNLTDFDSFDDFTINFIFVYCIGNILRWYTEPYLLNENMAIWNLSKDFVLYLFIQEFKQMYSHWL